LSAAAAAALKKAQAPVQAELDKRRAEYEKHYRAGLAAMMNKKYADAVKAFEEALKIMPNGSGRRWS
jgi:TolA-binding protein